MRLGDKITVVSLCYKNYKELYATIDSVLNQDYPNIEYIISDDGCDLFPMSDVEKYIKTHSKGNICKYIVRKNDFNVGTVKHENVVSDIIEGEYVVELSCGDTFFDNKVLTNIVNKIVSGNEDILVFRRVVCDECGRDLYYLPHIRDIENISRMNGKDQYEALICGHFWGMASGSAVAYKTDFIRKNRFDEKYMLIEDYPFFTKYTWNNKLDCCYDIVAIRYSLGGVSNTVNPLINKDMNTYNKYDRIEHFGEVSLFTKEKVRYQLQRTNHKISLHLILRFPHIILWLLIYKLNQKIGIIQDRKLLSKNICLDQRIRENNI